MEAVSAPHSKGWFRSCSLPILVGPLPTFGPVGHLGLPGHALIGSLASPPPGTVPGLGGYKGLGLSRLMAGGEREGTAG